MCHFDYLPGAWWGVVPPSTTSTTFTFVDEYQNINKLLKKLEKMEKKIEKLEKKLGKKNDD